LGRAHRYGLAANILTVGYLNFLMQELI